MPAPRCPAPVATGPAPGTPEALRRWLRCKAHHPPGEKKNQPWRLLSPASPSVLSPGDAGGGVGSALDTVGSVSPGLVAVAAPRPGRS